MKSMVVDTHLYFLLWFCPCKPFQQPHQDDKCFLWVTATPLRTRNASIYLSAVMKKVFYISTRRNSPD